MRNAVLESLRNIRMTRREFFVGGAAFGALGAFGGNRFVASAIAFSVRPRLRFGVVSDVHIMSADAPDTNGHSGSPETFRKTLEWFRGQEVDAVDIDDDDGFGVISLYGKGMGGHAGSLGMDPDHILFDNVRIWTLNGLNIIIR